MPEHVHVIARIDHGADARQVEAGSEDRRQAEQLPLVVGQEVVGPLHRMAERELPFRPRHGPHQHTEAFAESPCGVTPSTVAIAAGTEDGSATDASSIIHTPSGNSPATSAATSRASRVLPTPPTPLSVISRLARTSSATSATTSSRPTSEL